MKCRVLKSIPYSTCKCVIPLVGLERVSQRKLHPAVVDRGGENLSLRGVTDDRIRMKELLMEVERLSRSLRDPSLSQDGLKSAQENKKTA